LVNGQFTFFIALTAGLPKGIEASLHPFEFIAQIASRGEFRNQIGPAKLAQIRASALIR